MRKNDYLSSPTVKEFIAWMETILDTPQGFVHKYFHVKEDQTYEFDNLYDACEKYYWPHSGSIDELSKCLRRSIQKHDEHSCRDVCESILKWGGVWAQNKKHLAKLNPSLCSYLLKVRTTLESDKPSNEYYLSEILITSGFSKIYSALMDDYMIYDSRVGAALCLLVRVFCEQNKHLSVPDELEFAVPTSRSPNRRNPSGNKYKFTQIRSNPKKYLENNVRANWLISAVGRATKSKFTGVAKPLRLRALEKALFMIGYDVSGDCAAD